MLPKISDTHPEAERVQIEGLRAMTPARRIRILDELSMTVRTLALAGIRHRFPNASEGEMRLHLSLAAWRS
jgi:hypothetical protein